MNAGGRGGALELLNAFFVIVLGILLVTDLVRRFLSEQHLGWRRLTLVAAIAVGALVAGFRHLDGQSIGDTVATGFVATAVAAIFLIYGRAIFIWVSVGFQRDS